MNVCEASTWRLEPRPLSSHSTRTYTYGVIITPRVCSGKFVSSYNVPMFLVCSFGQSYLLLTNS